MVWDRKSALLMLLIVAFVLLCRALCAPDRMLNNPAQLLWHDSAGMVFTWMGTGVYAARSGERALLYLRFLNTPLSTGRIWPWLPIRGRYGSTSRSYPRIREC